MYCSNVLKAQWIIQKPNPTCFLYFSWREEIVPMLYGYETWVAQVNHSTCINVCIPRWLLAHPLTVKHTRGTASKDDTSIQTLPIQKRMIRSFGGGDFEFAIELTFQLTIELAFGLSYSSQGEARMFTLNSNRKIFRMSSVPKYGSCRFVVPVRLRFLFCCPQKP